MELLIVTVAGAAGAVLRYLLSGWVQGAGPSDFPTGTLAVNLSGAFPLGMLAGAGDLQSLVVVATVGFLGGFTTFSTWMIETLRLGPVSITSLLNLALTLVGGIALTALGHSLVT